MNLRPFSTPKSLKFTQNRWLATNIQWKLFIMRCLGSGNFVPYIRSFVTSVVNKQYKRKEIHSLGPEKMSVCYIMELQTQGVETLFNPSVPSSTPPLSSQQGILRLIAHYRRKSSWARSDDHRQSRFAHVQNVLRSHNAFRVYNA